MFWQQTHRYDIENSLYFQNIVCKYFGKICGIGPEFEDNWNGVFLKYDNHMSTLLMDIINYSNLDQEFFTNEEKNYLQKMYKFYLLDN